MVGDDGAVRCGERLYQMAKIEGPGGVAMDHDDRFAFSLIDEMKRHAVSVQMMGTKRVQVLVVAGINRFF